MSRAPKRVTSKWQRFRQQDKFVQEALRLAVRSRSYFKLEEMDRRFGLLRRGMTVLDLGAAPGGWSQYVQRKIGTNGRVVAVDINAIQPIDGVEIIQLDLAAADSIERLSEKLQQRKAHVVLSDMAPNITGNSAIDSRNYFDIYAAIFRICHAVLDDSGSLVFKFFQTDETQILNKECALLFESYRIHKPKASRSASQEAYLVASGYRPEMAADGRPLIEPLG